MSYLPPGFFLQQEYAWFLAGPGACGLWPILSLVNLELIIGATDHYSNIQLLAFLDPSNCIVSLPSIGAKLRSDYSNSSQSYNCSILPTFYLLYIQQYFISSSSWDVPHTEIKTYTYEVYTPLRGISLSFSGVKSPHRVLPPLKCTNSSIDHISHILENGQKSFFIE